MLPYCGTREALLPAGDPRLQLADWECVRGITLGAASLGVLAVGAVALVRIGAMSRRTGAFKLNLLMLALASLQGLLTAIKYLAVKEQKLTFSAAYLRGLQTLLTSANYATAAAESYSDPARFSRYFFMLLVVLVLYLSVLFLVAMGEEDFDCYHPHWLIMSSSQFLIVCLFAIPGLKVMRRLSGALQSRREYSGLLNSNQGQMQQQQRALGVLLVVNGMGAIAQLVLDAWLATRYQEVKACVIFESATEELARLGLKIFSYDLPLLATVYCYYWLHRRQFQTDLDIRLTEEASLEEAFSIELRET